MVKLAVVLVCAVVGLLLYRRGNSIYTYIAANRPIDTRQKAWSAGLSGLSAGILFVGLTLLMSFQSPDFMWTLQSLAAILAIAAILGLVVAGVTAAKIYAFRRVGSRWFVAALEEAENSSEE